MNSNTFRYGSPFMDNKLLEPPVIAMYMAQIPWTQPEVPPTYPSDKIDWTGTNVYTATDPDLTKLLEAISKLEGATAEIYRLKALAFTIKARLASQPQVTITNEQPGT